MSANRKAPDRNGFTLVEMMIALLIFAVIAGGALALLRFSVDAEFASREKTGEIAAARRMIAVWSADMAQASPRPARNDGAEPRPAMDTEEPGQLIAVTRAGWDNPTGQPRSSLQRVIWRMDGNDLVRIGQPFVDGAQIAQPSVMAQVSGTPTLRFRMTQGNWVGQWQPADPTELPAAVELSLPQPDGTVLTVVSLVGSGPEVDDEEEGDEGAQP